MMFFLFCNLHFVFCISLYRPSAVGPLLIQVCLMNIRQRGIGLCTVLIHKLILVFVGVTWTCINDCRFAVTMLI